MDRKQLTRNKIVEWLSVFLTREIDRKPLNLPSVLKQTQSQITTNNGVTWDYICKSGLENPDSKIGVYAGDEESYALFWDKFEPIVFDYHYNHFNLKRDQINYQHPQSCF